MKIKIYFNRSENILHYNSEETEIDLEEYVRGVVAAEVGNYPLEACKALAVAARTNALPYARQNKTISDTNPQAFRASRLTDQYSNAKCATEQTYGEVLYYDGKLADPASYSSNNGGHTQSSKNRWGTFKPWLIEQTDEWDNATKVTGHRVGMSQCGAKNAANIGYGYKAILTFYYPHTNIHNEYKQEVSNMAYATVKASWLIDKFKYMVDNHWPYVANGASERAVDCSGAFTYWYKKAGSYMYHGSNTMYRRYSILKGKIGQVELVPGMAVYKHRDDGKEPAEYQSDGLGNFYHVGLYIGNNKVAEAKGTSYGCVYSDLSQWSYCSKLKYTDYDVDTGDGTDAISGDDTKPMTGTGTVKIERGYLNVRSAPSTTGTVIGKLYKGDTVNILGTNGSWYAIQHNNLNGYCSAQYIELNQQPVPQPESEPQPEPASQYEPALQSNPATQYEPDTPIATSRVACVPLYNEDMRAEFTRAMNELGFYFYERDGDD